MFKAAIRAIVNLYIIMIIMWAIFSWFDIRSPSMRDAYRFLDSIVRPYIEIFERFIPLVGNISIAPIIAILVLEALVWLLI